MFCCMCAREYQLNPLKPNLYKIIFTNSVPTSKKTQFLNTKTICSVLCKEIITVHSDDYMKLINTLCANCRGVIINTSGRYIYQRALKG
jgi:hypothetical protein